MFHLIKKDFLMQKKTLQLSLLLMIFFSVTLSTLGSSGLTISILAICYHLALGASALEDKNNSDVMLVSLPIKKAAIVLSKYMSIYVMFIYAALVNYIICTIADVLNLSTYFFPYTLDGIYGAMIAVTLLFSVSFPIIFKIGYLKSKMINFIILFVFIFVGAAIVQKLSQYVNMDFVDGISNVGMISIVIVLLAILLIASYFLSLHFYKHREL